MSWTKNATTSCLPTAWACEEDKEWERLLIYNFFFFVLQLLLTSPPRNTPLESPSVHRSPVCSGPLRRGSRFPGPPGHRWLPDWNGGSDGGASVKTSPFLTLLLLTSASNTLCERQDTFTDERRKQLSSWLTDGRGFIYCILTTRHQPFLSYLARGVTLKLLIGTDLTVLIERLWQINNRGRPLWYTCPQPRCGADLKQCCQGTFLQLMSEWADWLYLSQLCRMGHCVRRSQGDISDYLCWSRWTCSGVCASVCLTCTVQLRRPPTCPWRSGLRFFSAASRLLCACVSYTRKCEQSTRQSGRHVFSSITSWHHKEDKWQRQTNAKQIMCE